MCGKNVSGLRGLRGRVDNWMEHQPWPVPSEARLPPLLSLSIINFYQRLEVLVTVIGRGGGGRGEDGGEGGKRRKKTKSQKRGKEGEKEKWDRRRRGSRRGKEKGQR